MTTGNIKIHFNVRCFVDFISDMLRGFVTILVHHTNLGKNITQDECIWCVNVAFNRLLENKIDYGWQHKINKTYKGFPEELFYKNPRTVSEVLTQHFNGINWKNDFQFSYSEKVLKVFTQMKS